MDKKRNKLTSLILASASPRRKSLLKKAGFSFRVIPSHAVERTRARLTPAQKVKALALIKARSIAKKYPDKVVLGADTLVAVGKRVIGKPKNRKHAVQILSFLSGRWQRVYTGVAVMWNGGKKKRVAVGVSRVYLRPLTDKDIRHACRRHMDKAGAYAVQQKNDPFVTRIVGDYDNVVGLPLRVVKRLLRGVG